MYWSGMFVALFLFGSPAVYGIFTQWFKHKEHMLDKQNEGLRLQLQLEQVRQEHLGVQSSFLSADPLPKDAPWDDQVPGTYEMGYQHINRQLP